MLHSLDRHHGLMFARYDKGVVFQYFRIGGEVGIVLQSGEGGNVGCDSFPLGGDYFKLRVDGREKRGYKVLESVEYRHGAYERRRGEGHAAYGYRGDDIDGMVRFPGKEIAPGDVERKVHSLSSLSMFSM